jgi:multidrug efflux pump subunit AcrB
VRIRVSGDFESLAHIREIGIQADGRLFRLGDIASVERGFADPPTPRMRVQGQDAIGIGIAMNKGGDVIRLGDSCTPKPGACSSSCRWESTCTSWPTSRRSSASR